MDGKEMQLKTRFAPTPSGLLHKGNLFSLILTWLVARKNQGTILLRIDDIDRQRVRKEYLTDIFEVINWLGIDYDEGPSGVDDFERNFSQLKRLELYHQAISHLESQPNVTFRCQCSRSQILKMAEDGNYPGTCLNKTIMDNIDTSLRIVTPSPLSIKFEDAIRDAIKIKVSERMRHFILRKKDGAPSYQLSSVIDDQYFGINTIVRGDDLIYSSAAQLFLSRYLKTNTLADATFYHHPLVTNGSSKLSKSQGDSHLVGANRNAHGREQLIKEFCLWMGYTEEVGTLKELFSQFEFVHLKQLRQTTD